MLRLRSHLLSAVRAASPLPAASSLRRLPLYSSAAAAATTTMPAAQFSVEDYLANSCGLTRAQARMASGYLPDLKSPSNPDAVRGYLAGMGIGQRDVAAALSRNPRFLCSSVDETLAPRIAELRGVGLSTRQISRLITAVPDIFVAPGWIPRIAFYLSLLGSYRKLHTALRKSKYLLSRDLKCVVKPNVAFLLKSGLTHSDIAKVVVFHSHMLTLKPRRLMEIMGLADMLGVRPNSVKLKHFLASVLNISPGEFRGRLDFLKKALGCNKTEPRIVVLELPKILYLSEDRLSCVIDFLKTEVGLETAYIVRRPLLLKYSMTRYLMPRHYVLKALKANGLEKDVGFYTAVCLSKKKFIKRFLDPYMESVPGLADAYAAAYGGQDPHEIQP
ncbi:hypothetical protein HU200_002089 [Digitaria exilis]|uniref:Uncharacterized protein n=1 Tax=Digitaria exilis TaxID=1010633 RepID=A0A835FX47_9POAL|nr:hypothetical protein HU200_002089 [Digitaria exilis]CAB3448096.1 unnamed protein product [Digitaria exilis]